MLAPLMQTLSSIPSDAVYYAQEEFIEHFGVNTKLFNRLLEDEILKHYLHHAKELAQLESTMQEQLCAKRDKNNFSTLWKIMFETLFTAKEYIFQCSTYKALLISIKEELLK